LGWTRKTARKESRGEVQLLGPAGITGLPECGGGERPSCLYRRRGSSLGDISRVRKGFGWRLRKKRKSEFSRESISSRMHDRLGAKRGDAP